ncbi:hypothetical protein FRB94_001984 [Tulasnella sp. JGI-2019a]|nr:hypothetical protein FRB93_010066 [Tulasnella sp. JGI-2019a]KAG9004946.1 hypothetical protein FRB94_001984 [Tulasnella sp. JGI-2019a]KAG9030141.1 hypothetical protein FRB95_004279 [Tulasnella sp. JGI-2019a]
MATQANPPPTFIYKIISSATPPDEPLPTALPVSPLDQRSQFIHASTSAQVLGTLNAFFADEPRIYILRIPYARVKQFVKWEDSNGLSKEEACWDASVEGGAGLFPHIYNGLKLGKDEVDEVKIWERNEEGWLAKGWPFGDVDVPK